MPLLLGLFVSVAVSASADQRIIDPATIINPFKVIAEKVDLTVGESMTLVSDRCTLQYVEAEDTGHVGMVWIRYPVYTESDVNDSDEAARAEDVKLEAGGNTYRPIAGGYADISALSDFPLIEGARVFFLTFALPRNVARVRFEVVITRLQPNFHYRNANVTLYTPWMPRQESRSLPFRSPEHPFSVSAHASAGLTLHLVTSAEKAYVNTSTDISVVAEHRQTVAAEVSSSPAAKGGSR